MFSRRPSPERQGPEVPALLRALGVGDRRAPTGWRRTMLAFLAAGGYSLAVTQLSAGQLQLLGQVIQAFQSSRCVVVPVPSPQATPAE